MKPKCSVDGCNNVVANKGSGRLRKVCGTHHHARLRSFDVSKCVLCGWNKARCDKHRLVWGCNGGKYIKGNIVSLCPNCHRLIHLGKVTIS